MLINISSPQTLGLLIRASRKQQKIRMDDVAGSAGVGPVFVREVDGRQAVELFEEAIEVDLAASSP